MPLTNLQWLRKLIEDEPTSQAETSVADGLETFFYVSNPPISGAPTVSVAGVASTDFTTTSAAVVFAAPPAEGAQVVIRYTRQTFTDDELETYLAAAGERFTGTVGVIYQAAVYAIDSLMMGASTALDFGAGAESYSMTSVWQRLQGLRDMYSKKVDEVYSEELGDNAPGAIVISDFLFDSYHYATPEYLQHLDDRDVDW